MLEEVIQEGMQLCFTSQRNRDMEKSEKVENSDKLLFEIAALWLGTCGLMLIVDLPTHHIHYFSFHCDELPISQIIDIGVKR